MSLVEEGSYWGDSLVLYLHLSDVEGIQGCIPMHPFFAFMQRVGVYTVEQRTGPRLVAESRLPATFASFASLTRSIPKNLSALKVDLDRRHGGREVVLKHGLITHLTTYDRYLGECEAQALGYPLSPGARVLSISRVRVLDPPLEVKFANMGVRYRDVTHVRPARA